MTIWLKFGAALVVSTGVFIYNGSTIVDQASVLVCGARDEVVGDAQLVDSGELFERLRGKNALVVGGTKGIGRGVARTIASSGGNVWVMGRTAANTMTMELLESEAELVGEQLEKALLKKHPENPLGSFCLDEEAGLKQVFRGIGANLYTKEGCIEAVRQIEEVAPPSAPFDYVVFTVGQWPDRTNPNTERGVNKVLALDIYARYTVFTELQKRGLVSEKGRVMNVLASTWDFPGVTAESVKEVVDQGETDFNKGGLNGLLGAASVSADSFVFTAAARYPSISFIGAHPGLVQTELATNSNAFPSWFSYIDISSFFKVTERESGRRLCSVLTSPNVNNRNYAFFNHIGEGRKTRELAYNEEFGAWLWKKMERFGEKEKSE